jgi:hypothetical protein
VKESMMKKLTAEDPETKSADLVAENIAQLQAIFPDAVTEGRIDFDVLKQLLGGAVDDRGRSTASIGTANGPHGGWPSPHPAARCGPAPTKAWSGTRRRIS